MDMNPLMLFFALFDSGIAFFLVYYVVKAKFGGEKKAIARILSSILGILVFIVYFATIIWFNTDRSDVTELVRNTVYAAPIVLSILMLILVTLSKPPKPKKEEETKENDLDEDNNEDNL